EIAERLAVLCRQEQISGIGGQLERRCAESVKFRVHGCLRRYGTSTPMVFRNDTGTPSFVAGRYFQLRAASIISRSKLGWTDSRTMTSRTSPFSSMSTCRTPVLPDRTRIIVAGTPGMR